VDLTCPSDPPISLVHSEVRLPFNQVHHLLTHSLFQSAVATAKDYEDLDRSLAQRRGRREHRQLPKRYRDVLPEPPAALPPASVLTGAQTPALSQASSPVLFPVRKILKSARNVFGLFRQHHAASFPDHDPNENIVSDDFIDSSLNTHQVETYHPYPNQSSFLLGEWYWNDGVQKSQSSFQNLLKIVGHPEFRPEDVACLNWKSIDAQLGGDRRVVSLDDEGSWQDEQVDGDWVKTPIKIMVPFHKRMLHPGEKVFDAGILHHRKLVSVIREKITSPSSHPHLHFEPYELYWQPKESSEPVRVHGELYTSEAFIEAHHDLQSATREPGCDLARVVVGLMFASDGTQLANFSNAKLSPVYLGIGNESKDRRSKPSCKAFEHIAYFETVSMAISSLQRVQAQPSCTTAPRCTQIVCEGIHWWERT
jgi:Plavaka transposase